MRAQPSFTAAILHRVPERGAMAKRMPPTKKTKSMTKKTKPMKKSTRKTKTSRKTSSRAQVAKKGRKTVKESVKKQVAPAQAAPPAGAPIPPELLHHGHHEFDAPAVHEHTKPPDIRATIRAQQPRR